ncbi:MAG: hypothetical protein CM15mP55_1150 [Hyphomicrobiales bacterium]|nr:MAG: hypothetical protein CM15mP55_1150 [Hyphomicrobiales bacterium]
MRVNHCLLGLKGASVDTLTHVHSHEMALGQCRNLIGELDLKPMVSADTAGAARELAEANVAGHGAIASKLAAEIYGLDVLRENIEDSRQNTTRFLIMSASPDDAVPEDGDVITSFIFRVRNVPAALYKALGGFATNNVNMTKLESYQPNGFLARSFMPILKAIPKMCRCAGTGRAEFLLLANGYSGRLQSRAGARRFTRRLILRRIFSGLTRAVGKGFHQLMRNRHAWRHPDGPVTVHGAAHIFAANPARFFKLFIVQCNVATCGLGQTPDHH